MSNIAATADALSIGSISIITRVPLFLLHEPCTDATIFVDTFGWQHQTAARSCKASGHKHPRVVRSCIGSVVCVRLDNMFERQSTDRSLQTVQHCERGLCKNHVCAGD